MSTPIMTLDEFRATGRDCDNLGKALDDDRWTDDVGRGRLYCDVLYIERRPVNGWQNPAITTEWCLMTDGLSEYLSNDLPRLEALLYEWAVENEYVKVKA